MKNIDETNGLNLMSNTAIFHALDGRPVVVCGKNTFYLRENIICYILKGTSEDEQTNRLFLAICHTTATI